MKRLQQILSETNIAFQSVLNSSHHSTNLNSLDWGEKTTKGEIGNQ